MEIGSTEEIGGYKIIRQEFHPSGNIFYDVHGHKYIHFHDSGGIARLTKDPDPEVRASLQKALSVTDLQRPVATLCGAGWLHRLSKNPDPRELSGIEYFGEMMYNMEADRDLGYLIINRMKFGPSEHDGLPGSLTIRGSFKRVLLVDCDIVSSKINIISDINPEIFIVSSNVSTSALSVTDDDANEHPKDRLYFSDSMPSEEEYARLVEYVKSNSDHFISEPPAASDGLSATLGAAACLAVASLVAISGNNKKSVAKEVSYGAQISR